MFKCQINIELIFPNEIMLKIFSNLDLQDLGRCTMVSKTFSELSRHSIFVLLQNVTGLKDISRAMKILHAHPVLMECVWKFYEINKEWQKEHGFVDKHGLVDKHGYVDKHGFASTGLIDAPIKAIETIVIKAIETIALAPIALLEDIGKSTQNIDHQFEKVSCFLKHIQFTFWFYLKKMIDQSHKKIN